MTRRPVAGFRRRTVLVAGTIALAACLALPARALAQDVHLVVIAGVGGDEEHVKDFNAKALAVLKAAKKADVPDAGVTYLGESAELSEGQMKARATKENVTKAFTDLAARAKPNDTIFVLLIGHGSFDGKLASFNLPGPDLTTADYATLLNQFKTQKITFVNTASSSGPFIDALKGPARVIVTATKVGGERNETRFAQFFVEALDSESADRDRNGRVSVQEAFDYAAAKTAADYQKGGNIPTEHPTIDDGSQGKLASTLYLAPERSRTAAAQAADPALRALLEQRDALERQVNDLRLKKDTMDADRYEQELEKLLTELAVKTRSIRELEGKK
jgi:hypothetical protein